MSRKYDIVCPPTLHVKDPWLFYIQTGEKKIEGRQGSREKFAKWIGSEVSFYNDKRKIPVEVTDVRHYDNLYQYLDKEGVENAVPGIQTKEEAVKIYHGFYSDESITSKGGMNAIVVKLVRE